MVTAVEKAVTS